MRTHWLILLSCLLASASRAAAPVDLLVQPVEFGALIGAQCYHALSSAVVSSPFSIPGGTNGTLQVVALSLPNGARVDVDGSASGPAGSVSVAVQIEVDVAIPDVGDAMTPLFASLDHWDHLGAQWRLARATLVVGRISPSCVTTEATPTSSFLGAIGAAPGATASSGFRQFASYANLASMASPVRATEPHSFIAGDTVRLPLLLSLEFQYSGSADGFLDSINVELRTAPPTLGSGDVNGDRKVDLLDVTFLRRRLAGLPGGLP
jgi:hypothetical protein